MHDGFRHFVIEIHDGGDIRAIAVVAENDESSIVPERGERVQACAHRRTTEDVAAGLARKEGATEGASERVHLLVVREGDELRPVAELARDYEPGAFGVHDTAEVERGELEKIHGHEVVVVKSEQSDNDSNLPGIELCVDDEKLETVCTLGEMGGLHEVRANRRRHRARLHLGVDPDPAEVDDDTKKTVAELRKAKTTRSKASWQIAEDGNLTVQVVSGSAPMLKPTALLTAFSLGGRGHIGPSVAVRRAWRDVTPRHEANSPRRRTCRCCPRCEGHRMKTCLRPREDRRVSC